MGKFPYHGLEDLARRTASGQVVFFVGAGFSLDSEGNTSKRLIRRLLARFEAIVLYLSVADGIENPSAPAGAPSAGTAQCTTAQPIGDMPSEARELWDAIFRTFDLPKAGQRQPPQHYECLASDAHVDSLSRQYYAINDWMCSAFAQLVQLLKRFKDAVGAVKVKEAVEAINTIENAFLSDRDPVALETLDLDKLLRLGGDAARGKALFLDTMGFADPKIMGGEPFRELSEAEATYRGRLLPRHHVLARLAREGLSSILVTTNYDLLLEGAYRLAGFGLRVPQSGPDDLRKWLPSVCTDRGCDGVLRLR